MDDKPYGFPVDKVKIFADDYNVIWENADWEIGQKLFGQCVPDTCEIHITTRISGYKLACVFLHEVAHALAAWDGCYSSADGEQVANLASYDMVNFWRDNPEVFDWWIGIVKNN
ncbi:MAG: hypothetical protein WC455_11890 [Dehalococcoidia bacterium]|jgi:hypothetical protein